MSKFKVGDRVMCVNKKANPDSCLVIGNEYKVDSVSSNYIVLDKTGSSWSDYQFELVEEECEPCGVTLSSENAKEYIDRAVCGMYQKGVDFGIKPLQEVINKKTIMSKITNFVKNSLLSADEKLMRKYGLKDECGEFTNEAINLVVAKLTKENETYIIEVAKGLETEEKANK